MCWISYSSTLTASHNKFRGDVDKCFNDRFDAIDGQLVGVSGRLDAVDNHLGGVNGCVRDIDDYLTANNGMQLSAWANISIFTLQ